MNGCTFQAGEPEATGPDQEQGDIFESFLDLSGELNAYSEEPDRVYPVSASCKLCNNKSWKTINRLILRSNSDFKIDKIAKDFGVSKGEIYNHLVYHMAPMYGEIFFANLDSATKERITKSGLARKAIMIADDHKQMATPMRRRVCDKRVFDPFGEEGANTFLLAKKREAYQPFEYKYDKMLETGEGEDGWDEGRLAMETSLRAKDSINFMQEMKDVKHRFLRIYDEIMDGPPPEKYNSDGALQVGERNYSAAVAANRGILDTMKTLVVTAAIAAKSNEDGGRTTEVSRRTSDLLKIALGDAELIEQLDLTPESKEIGYEVISNNSEAECEADYIDEGGGEVEINV